MRPPTSFPGTALAGLALLGAGVAVGAYAGSQLQAKNGGLAQGTGMALGGAFGGLAASFVGLLAGSFKTPWADVGETAALLGFGGMTVMATVTAFGPGGVFGSGPALGVGSGSSSGGALPPTGGVVAPTDAGGGGSSF